MIIAHESVLRVLYAYLMHCSTMDIPLLKFPRDEIIEIIPASYQNEAKRIHIPGVDPGTVPGSPDDIKIPVSVGSFPPSGVASGTASGIASGVASGQMSPIPGGLSSPAEPIVERPPEKVINTAKDMVADKVDDED